MTVTLIEFIAATPCAGGSRSSARITKVEKAKKTPATRPVPTAPVTVRVRIHPSIIERPPCRPRPGPGGGRVACELGEVAWFPTEGVPDTVGEAGVATVEHLREQIRQELHVLVGDLLLDHARDVVVHRDRHEGEVATGRATDRGDCVGERQQPRTGQLVQLTRVSGLGECGDRDVGDVVDVDERFDHVAHGQRDLSEQHRLQEITLAEVLRKPRCAQDRPLDTCIAYERFGALGALLAAAREQDEPFHARADGLVDERADRLGRTGDGDVGGVRDVHGGDAVEGRGPRLRIFPVEGRDGRAGADPDGAVAIAEPIDDTATGLAGAAGNQGQGRIGGGSVEVGHWRFLPSGFVTA